MFVYNTQKHEGWIHAARSNKFIARIEYFPSENYARAIITPRTEKSVDYLRTFDAWLEPTVGHFFNNPVLSFNHRLARETSIKRALASYYLNVSHETYYMVKCDNVEALYDWYEFSSPFPGDIPYRNIRVPSLKVVENGKFRKPMLTEWWINPLCNGLNGEFAY